MEAQAIAKTVRMGPRKARLVIDLIRGKHVSEANAVLKGFNTKASIVIEKVLNSAIANAENNLGLSKDALFVKEAYVNEGQTMKRARMGSRGHVNPIKKRTSHVTIVVSDNK